MRSTLFSMEGVPNQKVKHLSIVRVGPMGAGCSNHIFKCNIKFCQCFANYCYTFFAIALCFPEERHWQESVWMAIHRKIIWKQDRICVMTVRICYFFTTFFCPFFKAQFIIVPVITLTVLCKHVKPLCLIHTECGTHVFLFPYSFPRDCL